MQIDLSQKNILVTGASRGIGRSITESLSQCGANVGIHYSKSEDQARNLADKIQNAHIFKSDLSEPNEVIDLFNNFIQHFDHLDVLVNNAGIAINSPHDQKDNNWRKDWEETMKVNLNALALLCKKSIEHFSERNGGKIINISSRAAFRGDTSEYFAYAASKGGVVSLTRSIARAFGKKGIVAFNVAPGFTRTQMAQEFIDEYGEDYATSDLALNRMTEPEDIANFVVFLASGLADHATGCTIDINAGSYVH